MKRAMILAAAATVAGCAAPQRPIHEQTAEIRVETEDFRPIIGVSVFVDGRDVARTSREGEASVRLRGPAGERIAITTTCPDGSRLEGDAQEVFVTPGVAPRLLFRCEVLSRDVLVVVRADGGPNLPVRLLGREIGRTDASGAATVLVSAEAGETFELVLDTSRAPKLHPQSPALSFRATTRDYPFVFDQKFQVDKPKARVAARPAVPRAI